MYQPWNQEPKEKLTCSIFENEQFFAFDCLLSIFENEQILWFFWGISFFYSNNSIMHVKLSQGCHTSISSCVCYRRSLNMKDSSLKCAEWTAKQSYKIQWMAQGRELVINCLHNYLSCICCTIQNVANQRFKE